ncbi:MAG: glycoside hydrolase family 43 protein [Verrucomicrobiia bacterium]
MKIRIQFEKIGKKGVNNMIHCFLLFILIGEALGGGFDLFAQDKKMQNKTYRNPIIDRIGPADPHIIKYQGRYYLYPTTDGKGYDVFVSEDLVNWEQKPKVFTHPNGGAWAPDVFHDSKGDGKFYLYYTVNAKPPPDRGGKVIGVAVSSSPLGQFEDKGILVRDSIDAHMFRDDDGAYYLYYAELSGGFKIKVQPMANPLEKKSDAVVVIRPTEEWEKKSGAVTEGPFMIKRNGIYYLMYSGTGADSPNYGIGYATSKSPLGPFEKYKGNPIAHRTDRVLGPGHHSVIEGPDGRLWLVYHQKASTNIGWDRFLAIDPLWFDENGVINVKLSRGTDEPAP